MPWVNSRVNGSRSAAGATPRSDSALVKKRAYIRCSTACSAPPMYWSTGIQSCTASLENGASTLHGSQKRRKYHDESTKVSIVSVSRVAGPPQSGQVVCRNPSWKRSGDCPVGRNSTSSGASTGSSSSGTGRGPQASQYTIGIGHPQNRWRLTSQSRSRKLTVRSPCRASSSQAIAASLAAATSTPLRSGPGTASGSTGEFTWRPGPEYASPSQPSGRSTVSTIGMPNAVAKSQSRWSSPGTAITAPVP